MKDVRMQGVFGMGAAITLSKQPPAEASQLRTKKGMMPPTLVESLSTREIGRYILNFGNGNRKQLFMAREEFPTLGIDFVSMREALDTSTPMGNAMFPIVAARREESDSITPMEWKAARQISLRTTVLALNTRPGIVSNWRAVRVLKTDDRVATSAGIAPILRRGSS